VLRQLEELVDELVGDDRLLVRPAALERLSDLRVALGSDGIFDLHSASSSAVSAASSPDVCGSGGATAGQYGAPSGRL